MLNTNYKTLSKKIALTASNRQTEFWISLNILCWSRIKKNISYRFDVYVELIVGLRILINLYKILETDNIYLSEIYILLSTKKYTKKSSRPGYSSKMSRVWLHDMEWRDHHVTNRNKSPTYSSLDVLAMSRNSIRIQIISLSSASITTISVTKQTTFPYTGRR